MDDEDEVVEQEDLVNQSNFKLSTDKRSRNSFLKKVKRINLREFLTRQSSRFVF